MNWHSLEVWSDVVGLFSAVAMVVPAWKADSVAAFVGELSAALQRRPVGDPNGPLVLGAVERDASSWKPIDRRLLRAGVLLLSASFVLKMAHHAGYQL